MVIRPRIDLMAVLLVLAFESSSDVSQLLFCSRYNIANNTWTTIGKLNFARSAITAIVLTGVQNIEEYISALTQTDNSDGRSCTRHLQNEFSVERLLSRN